MRNSQRNKKNKRYFFDIFDVFHELIIQKREGNAKVEF